MGASLSQSQVVKGMVFPKRTWRYRQNAAKSKVVVFTNPIDISTTETKGTVLLHNAQEMLDFTKGEEQQLDQLCKEIHDSGVKVVVAGSLVWASWRYITSTSTASWCWECHRNSI